MIFVVCIVVDLNEEILYFKLYYVKDVLLINLFFLIWWFNFMYIFFFDLGNFFYRGLNKYVCVYGVWGGGEGEVRFIWKKFLVR